MRRLSARLAAAPALLILAGFVWFTIVISDPPEEAERPSLVTGSIHAAGGLAQDGPLVPYVALHGGVPPRNVRDVPEFPLDDRQPDESGAFELSADPTDGRRFYLLARFETAKQERYCELVPLPELRPTESGGWVVAAGGRPLAPQRLVVDRSTRCG